MLLSTYSKSEPSRVVMLVGLAGAGNNWLKSVNLVLLAFKSSWRPLMECFMALKLVWRVVNILKLGGTIFTFGEITFPK